MVFADGALEVTLVAADITFVVVDMDLILN